MDGSKAVEEKAWESVSVSSQTVNEMWDIAGMGWSGGKSEPRRVEERCAARGVQREVCRVDRVHAMHKGK